MNNDSDTYSRLIEAYLLLMHGDHLVFERYGLTSSQFVALRHIAQGDMRPRDLTQSMLLEKSSISRMLDRMVDEGLIERLSDPVDRRSQLLALTPKGREIFEDARHHHERSLQARMAGLSPAQHQQLLALLDQLCPHLSRLIAQASA